MKLTLTSLLLGTMLFCPCFFCELDITSAMVGLIGICATIMTIGNIYGIHQILETHKHMADIEKKQKELLELKEIADIQFHVAIGISNADKASRGCINQVMKALYIALKSPQEKWIDPIIKVLAFVCTNAKGISDIENIKQDIEKRLRAIQQLDLYPEYSDRIREALKPIIQES